MYALVVDGVVRELFEVQPVLTSELMQNVHECGQEVSVGWSYDGQGFTAPGMDETVWPTYIRGDEITLTEADLLCQALKTGSPLAEFIVGKLGL